MILVGTSWLLFWALVKVFTVDPLLSALVVAITFIILGLVLGERPFRN